MNPINSKIASGGSYGYNVTVVFGDNHLDKLSKMGRTYVFLGGNGFFEENIVSYLTDIRTQYFYIRSGHPIESVSHVVFRWEWSILERFVPIEKIIIEPTYLFPYSKNIEFRKAFCGQEKFTKASANLMTLFSVPC